MRFILFPVADRGFCCWGSALDQASLEFLRSLDPLYFSFQAELLRPALDGPDHQRAAIALRNCYFHSIETLFTLVAVALQAPDCIPAYIPLLRPDELRTVIERFHRGIPFLRKLHLEAATWNALASAVHAPIGAAGVTAAPRFARAWARLASDFLEPQLRAEYNSLKHGFRVATGGYTLRIGLERSFGVPGPPEGLRTVANSVYGSSFTTVEPLPGVQNPKRRNILLRRNHLNWQPASLIAALHIAAASAQNLISFLRIAHGEDSSAVQFALPTPDSLYDEPWRPEYAPTSQSWAEQPFVSDDSLSTVEEIEEKLRRNLGGSSGV